MLQRELDAMLRPEQRLADVRVIPWSEFPIGVTGKTLKRVFRERSEATVSTAAISTAATYSLGRLQGGTMPLLRA